MAPYFLIWRGKRSGPFTLDQIEQQLEDNEISVWYRVEGEEISVEDLLKRERPPRREAPKTPPPTKPPEPSKPNKLRELRELREQERKVPVKEIITPPTFGLPPEPPQPLRSPVFRTSSPPEFQSQPTMLAEAPSPFLPNPNPQKPRKKGQFSGKALCSFICCIFTIIGGLIFLINPAKVHPLFYLSWLAAIILGQIAMADCRQDPTLNGKILALISLWITYAYMVIASLVLLIIFLKNAS